jgi:hypothetical protein
MPKMWKDILGSWKHPNAGQNHEDDQFADY